MRKRLSICDRTYVHAGCEFYSDTVGTESGIEQVRLDDCTSGLPIEVGVPLESPWEDKRGVEWQEM